MVTLLVPKSTRSFAASSLFTISRFISRYLFISLFSNNSNNCYFVVVKKPGILEGLQILMTVRKRLVLRQTRTQVNNGELLCKSGKQGGDIGAISRRSYL